MVGALSEYADVIEGRPKVFVSCRRREATPLVARLVRRLAKVGYSCWWDRWSMSRSVAEGVAKALPPVLRVAIRSAIEHCQVGIVVPTRGYDHSAWTQLEDDCMRTAQEAGRLRMIIMSQYPGAKLSSDVARVQSGASAKALIEDVVAQLHL